ncbi:MAG TPA: hypothetical protein VF342_12500 [Alphaproteobacteria bacterium]
MKRLIRTLFGMAVGAAVATCAAAEEADPHAPGQARSVSFAPFPPELGVAIRPLDDSTVNLHLKDRFAAALAGRSVRVQEMPAPLVLNFETEVDQTFGRRTLGPGEVQISNWESQARLNLWSSTRDSVLGAPRDTIRGTLRYVLIATLDDEQTGRRLWQGEASYAGAPADEAAALAAMVPILADQFGRTVRQRSFRLE